MSKQLKIHPGGGFGRGCKFHIFFGGGVGQPGNPFGYTLVGNVEITQLFIQVTRVVYTGIKTKIDSRVVAIIYLNARICPVLSTMYVAKTCMSTSKLVLPPNESSRAFLRGVAFSVRYYDFLAPNLKGLGAYNLGSIRPSVRRYVRTSVDSDFSEVWIK